MTPQTFFFTHKLFLFSLLVCSFPCFSQSYNVADYQKINETNGGFAGNLNDFDSWGIAIDNIGDLDGNGVNDLAVGAYTDDDGGTDRGAVWILFLDADNQVIDQIKISDTQGGFTGVLEDDDRFGGAVAYLGDLNSDGRIELAVGADYDGDGGYWHGAVWILSLNNNGTVNSHVKISDTEGGFTGVINGDAIFGTDIENIGDLNNDDIADLAVASRRDADGGSRRGALWILFMNADLTVNSYQKISDTQGGFTPILEFEDYFGGSVLNMGDLDGDNVTDIVVGAYRDDDGAVNAGSFYTLYLNTDGTVKSSQKVSNLSGGLSHQISGSALFGESIDGTNDLDGDGRLEILVGALGHLNPTLSSATGGFYMIELNNDGTVSEDFFYTYGEHCFSGELNGGDYFGGAITLLNGGQNPKIAVSAYHDSENGPERGAIWILDLGDVFYTLSDQTDPSGCSTNDGSFTVSDLASEKEYTITYVHGGSLVTDNYVSDVNGIIQVTGLEQGAYNDIIVTENVINCTDHLGNIVLNGSSLDAQITITEPTECGANNGSIIISNLVANIDYTISYEYQSIPTSLQSTANTNGEIVVDELLGGSYMDFIIREEVNGCENYYGDVVLESSNADLQFVITSPTNCVNSDGNIQIIGLVPNALYQVTYDFNDAQTTNTIASDDLGQINLIALETGLYENIVVFDMDNGCTFSEPFIGLPCVEDNGLCFTFKKFFTPNGDGINDYWFLENDAGCDYFTQIYDRYGKLVAVLTPENPNWDGRYRGKPMPSTTYWCNVQFTDGTITDVYRFHFALKR